MKLQTEPLNVIVIQIDSLNRHFLSAYGNDWVQTPNLDAFARQAAVFDNHFVSSLPCMPARREIWTGTQEFWWRFWGPLEPWDLPLAHLARRADPPIRTHLVTDHYHFFEWGSHSYHYDFNGYDFIRGHELDNWRTDPPTAVPDWATEMVARRRAAGRIYLQNVQDFAAEADFFAPQVFEQTAVWLDRNHAAAQFYLHVDSFDVHEPFHIPKPYRSLYTDDDFRRHNPWPHYGRIDEGPAQLAADEVAWVRAQFAGKLTMVDRWLGSVFERLDRYDLWPRTAVIITTDHGHFLGEHGWMGKPDAPLYHTLTHIPLLIWHPHGAHNGRRLAALTQTVDLYATVLDLLGLNAPDNAQMHSRSLGPLLRDETTAHREAAVYGYWSQRTGVTDGRWTLLRDQDRAAAPAYLYTTQVEQTAGWGGLPRQERRHRYPELEAGRFLPGLDMPLWRRRVDYYSEQRQPRRPDLLFDQAADPQQQNNLAPAEPGVVARLEELLRRQARAVQAPPEQWPRLAL